MKGRVGGPTPIPETGLTLPPPPRKGGAGRVLLILALLASVAINFLFCCGGLFLTSFAPSNDTAGWIREKFHSGNASAADKIAIVHIDGPLVEGLLGFENKQIEEAAKDNSVKAVIVRINSPGGTISASDDLLRRL